MFQPVLLPILNWRLLCVSYIVIDFDVERLKHSRVEAINPGNIYVCFKDYLNVNMKFFPVGFEPVSPGTFQCLLRKKRCGQTKLCH